MSMRISNMKTIQAFLNRLPPNFSQFGGEAFVFTIKLYKSFSHTPEVAIQIFRNGIFAAQIDINQANFPAFFETVAGGRTVKLSLKFVIEVVNGVVFTTLISESVVRYVRFGELHNSQIFENLNVNMIDGQFNYQVRNNLYENMFGEQPYQQAGENFGRDLNIIQLNI